MKVGGRTHGFLNSPQERLLMENINFSGFKKKRKVHQGGMGQTWWRERKGVLGRRGRGQRTCKDMYMPSET